jgi:hypothetical protein
VVDDELKGKARPKMHATWEVYELGERQDMQGDNRTNMRQALLLKGKLKLRKRLNRAV